MTKQQVTRNRPRLNTTIADRTMAVILQASKDLGLSNISATMDFLIADWERMKRMTTLDPSPSSQEQPS